MSKTGDTVTGNLNFGNGTGANSPHALWRDKKRTVWAGTSNGDGDFYLYDSTNQKAIIHSNKACTSTFYGTATYAQNATGNLRTELNSKWTSSGASPTQTIPIGVNFGYDNVASGTSGFFIDFVFGDGTKSRLIYNSSRIEHLYFNGSTWHTEWIK